VTELTLIFVLQSSGILLALLLARLPAPPAAAPSVRRIGAALERAVNAFLLRGAARLAVVTGVLVAVAIGVGIARREFGASAVGALGAAVGAVLGALATWAGTALALRATGSALAAAERRFDLTLSTALSAGGAAGVLSQALGAFGALGLFLAELRLRGAGALPPDQAEKLAREAASTLPAYALAAALVALLVEGTSAAYRSAAGGGSSAAERHDPALSPWDPRNPALVSSLVGEQLAVGARAALAFATSAGVTSLVLVLATRGPALPDDRLRFAALPLVLTFFGLVASAAGVWVARPLEADGAGPALARGQASSVAVFVLGLAAACHWLFPDRFVGLACAAAIGLAAACAVGHLLTLASQRGGGVVRETTEAFHAGPVPAIAGALAGGLGYFALALVVSVAATLGARACGAATGAPDGALLGVLAALAGAVALVPYAVAVDSLAHVSFSARGTGGMAGVDTETARRLARLAETSSQSAALARSALLLAVALLALGQALNPEAAPGSPTDAPLSGLVLGGMALFGVATVLLQAGTVLRRAARGAREIGLEVARTLANTPAEPGETGGTSYRACENLCGRVGIAAALPSATIGLAGPVVLGIGLVLVYRVGGPRLAADALAMFVAGAAVTALGVALTVDGAHAVLAAARRANRPEGDPATSAASVTGDALFSLLRNALGPTVCFMALIAAAFALLVSPLLP
jgi:Na+/H+-translocating membrane pyrophosphatase